MSERARGKIGPGDIRGDRPLGVGDADKLGFRDVATRIAFAISNRSDDGGIVIGLDGKWGSGKSSLLHLIQEQLDLVAPSKRPTVINFRPWLVGSRDALLTALLSEFTSATDRLRLSRGDARGISAKQVKTVVENLRAFGHGLSKFGGVIEFAGEHSAIPFLKLLGNLLKRCAAAFKKS